MDNKIVIDEGLKKAKSDLAKVGSRLLEVANRLGANKETRTILEGQLENIKENFLFVIVGEVNAGKSSFVNALLGASICATSHDICTQDVQKITYGAVEKTITDDYNRIIEREYPAEILKEITVVDTPGTNSRELEHQVITERFVPKCNLVVFVFQLDNIHVQSAWDLFDKIKVDWTKKVVFVLTKADRYSPEEVQNYTKTLTQYAKKSGVEDPMIFVTSSKLEEEGQTKESGFLPVREYINNDVLENAATKKIAEDVKVIQQLLQSIEAEFEIRRQKFEIDNETRLKINNIIHDKEALAKANINTLAKRALDVYDSNSEKTVEKLDKGIGFFTLTMKSIKSIFGGEDTKTWLEKVNKEHVESLNKDINLVLSSGIDNIKSDISYMVIGVKEELDKLHDTKVTPSDMFAKLDEKRGEIIHTLKTNLTDFTEKSDVFKGKGVINKDEVDYGSVNVAGGIAAISTTIALISQTSVMDVTGGIATGLALIVAGGLAVSKKGKYLETVRETLATRREAFKEDLTQNLESYFNSIKIAIDKQFKDFDHHLRSEEEQIKTFKVSAREIKNDLEKIEKVSI